MLQSILVVAIALLLGFQIHVAAVTILALVFMALITATFIGVGLTLGSLINDFQGFQLVSSFFTMPLFFLSNSIFPATILPKAVQYIVYLNPLTYGVDGLRNALIGSGTFPIWMDLLAMAVSATITILIAIYAFGKTEVGG